MRNEHEKYWQKRFGEPGNTKVFEGWLDVNSSRKLTCSIVKDLIGKGSKNILDVGCGIGLDYLEYLKCGVDIEYAGVDVTPYFINKLKKEFPDVMFKLGRAQELPWKDNSFDIVSSRHVLEHLNEPDKVVQEMSRVSKKWVLNTFFRLTGRKTVYKKSKKYGSELVVNNYNAKEMQKIFEDSGLKIISRKRVDDKRKNGTNHIWLAEKQANGKTENITDN